MDTLDVVDRVDEVPDLGAGLGEVLVVGEIDLLFLDGAHESFGIAVRRSRHLHLICAVDEEPFASRIRFTPGAVASSRS